jgi:hypothetical protein
MALWGGYSSKELEPGIWRVSYGGNGYTTRETVQTYWLYRCSELALSNGFDGFEILSNIPLVERTMPAREVKIAASGSVPIFIPMSSPSVNFPVIEGDIRLLKLPFTPVPSKVFNAVELKSQLEPYVTGEKCNIGNVCPHAHHYLYPDK